MTVAAALILSSAQLFAQDQQPAKVPEPGACFRGRPLPQCKSFVIFELRYSHRLAGTQQTIHNNFSEIEFKDRDLAGYLALEVGRMLNTDSLHARGGAIQFGLTDEGIRIGLKARKRRWYSGGRTFDLSAGLLAASVRGTTVPSPRVMAYGITGGASVGIRDVVGLSLSGDLLRGDARTRAALHGGVYLGSFTGVVGTAIVATYITLLLIAFSGSST